VSAADPLIQASLLGEAVDNGPTPVFVADEDRRYIAVNRRACELVGYSREELLALRVDDLAAGTPGWHEMLENGSFEGNTELRRKDGTMVSFAYRAGGTVVAGMPVYVSVGV
jgi:PAS domain S-box-containing protein